MYSFRGGRAGGEGQGAVAPQSPLPCPRYPSGKYPSPMATLSKIKIQREEDYMITHKKSLFQRGPLS